VINLYPQTVTTTVSAAEETLESALDTLTKSYSCGQTAEPFDHPHLLHNATPAFIQPYLQVGTVLVKL
jgi:hypothetical protein